MGLLSGLDRGIGLGHRAARLTVPGAGATVENTLCSMAGRCGRDRCHQGGQTRARRVSMAEGRAALRGDAGERAGVGGWAGPHRALTFRRTSSFSLEPQKILEGL